MLDTTDLGKFEESVVAKALSIAKGSFLSFQSMMLTSCSDFLSNKPLPNQLDVCPSVAELLQSEV